MRRRSAALAACLLVLGTAGCASAGSGAAPEPGTSALPDSGAAASPAPATDTAPPRVAQIRLAASTTTPRAGDTVRVDATALDASGRPVPGIQVRLRAPSRQLAVLGDTALVALREGDAGVIADAFRDGLPLATSAAGRIELRVLPAPLARLELETPDRLLAGTRSTARVHAFTAAGPRDIAPDVRWRSSDQSVLRVSEAGGLVAVAPGTARLEATAEGRTAAADVRVVPNPVARVVLTPAFAELEVGEVVHLSARALDGAGNDVDVPVEWAVEVLDPTLDGSARIDGTGAFVANTAGDYRVLAAVGAHAAAAEMRARPRSPGGTLEPVARLPVHAPGLTGLRVFEGVDGRDYAYAGTRGGWLYAWDVTYPEAPALTDSVQLAGRVADVRIDADATIAVAATGAGVTLLDVLDPAHPRRLADAGEPRGGAHAVWVEGDVVYAAYDGSGDLGIVDISDPRAPRSVGRWEQAGVGKTLHSLTVKDGFAYLAAGNDGLLILDVGAGIAGGTPTEPRLVSTYDVRYRRGGRVYGDLRHAIRHRNRVFAADESYDCADCANGPRGRIHVLDVSDIEEPQEVAVYEVPEAAAHELWADDDRLYVAGQQGGVRIVDVSGELLGDLGRQGRELARYLTAAGDAALPVAAAVRGVQPYAGHVFAGDANSGLWILAPEALP